MVMVILSCDKYEPCWKPFFTLLEKYYPHHPEVYLITETKECPYCKTINVDSQIWTERFREGLKQIDDNEVLIMLDDFFIRQPVDKERLARLYEIHFILDEEELNKISCFNFELEYREPLISLGEWDVQKNNQVYLNSCQPSIWNRKVLIERLQKNQTAQEWELTPIDSPYVHLINNGDYIIDIGYRHQDLSVGWGITRGKLSKECLEFLEKEGLADEIINYYPLL